MEKSIQTLRKKIIKGRRERCFDANIARKCWEELTYIENECGYSLELYLGGIRDSEHLFKHVCSEDLGAVPICTEYNTQCVAFWEKVWPYITAYWRRQKEASANSS